MKLEIKTYKCFKTKKYFRDSNLFFIYNGTNVKNSVKIDQKLKKLNLKYYKVYNTLTRKVLDKSIYKNFQHMINSLVLVIKPDNSNNSILTFKSLLKLDDSLKLVVLKIENNIFTISKTNSSLQLNYKNSNLLFFKTLKTSLKNIYKLTQKSSK